MAVGVKRGKGRGVGSEMYDDDEEEEEEEARLSRRLQHGLASSLSLSLHYVAKRLCWCQCNVLVRPCCLCYIVDISMLVCLRVCSCVDCCRGESEQEGRETPGRRDWDWDWERTLGLFLSLMM